MNEVEKLYKRVRIKKEKVCVANDCLDMSKCSECYFSRVPESRPFTAEKQLELFGLIMRPEKTEVYCKRINGRYRILVYTEDCCANAIEDSFEEALASVTCDIWDLFSKEEKKEVKEILK